MFGMFRKIRTSTKLTCVVGTALAGLCLMGVIAVFAANSIQSLGRDLYAESDRGATVQLELAVGIERAISNVHSAPSELDLEQLKQKRARFDSLMADIRKLLAGEVGRSDKALAATVEQIGQHLEAFESGSKKVFELSAAFAQMDAIAMLASGVVPAETAIQTNLRAYHDATARAGASQVAAMEKAASSVTWLVLGLTGLIVVGLSVLAYTVVSRGVVRPINTINRVMLQLADGATTIDVPYVTRLDEIGGMARAVEVFRQHILEAERLSARQEESRAARAQRQDEMERHTEDFGTSVSAVLETLEGSAAGMRRAAEAMARISGTLHDEATSTSKEASRSSLDLTAVAASVEQMTATVHEISRQVATAAEVSRQAVRRTEASQESIRSLGESTSRIGDVVSLISEIAGQTNLLALNATIEAARAGDAGKGFAVVAGEVKALAAQTAKATTEIGGQIDTVRRATEATILAMAEIGGMIRQMDEVSTTIAAAVEEQSVTTRGIATSVQAVSDATVQSVRAMGHVVEVADQAGAASKDVLGGASKVGEESGRLGLEVQRFLAAVRTDTDERRAFERINGENIVAVLRVPGRDAIKAKVNDLSLGGIALWCELPIEPRTEVSIELPNVDGALIGNVSRSGTAGLGIEFRADAATRSQVERAMRSLSSARRAA